MGGGGVKGRKWGTSVMVSIIKIIIWLVKWYIVGAYYIFLILVTLASDSMILFSISSANIYGAPSICLVQG